MRRRPLSRSGTTGDDLVVSQKTANISAVQDNECVAHLLISASREAASKDILERGCGLSTAMAPCAGSDKRPPVLVLLEMGTPILFPCSVV